MPVLNKLVIFSIEILYVCFYRTFIIYLVLKNVKRVNIKKIFMKKIDRNTDINSGL